MLPLNQQVSDANTVFQNQVTTNAGNINLNNEKGIIIAGKYDKKLDYALEYAPFDTQVFIYNVSFTLNEFKK
jgi:hypothetical protein